MRTIIFLIICLYFLVLASCQRDTDRTLNQKTAAEKILGRWRLQQSVSEQYHPANELADSDEYIGKAGDSIVFEQNNLLHVYKDLTTDVVSYHLINDSTIDIDHKLFRIRKLTDTEFNLYLEEMDAIATKKFIVKTYLVR